MPSSKVWKVLVANLEAKNQESSNGGSVPRLAATPHLLQTVVVFPFQVEGCTDMQVDVSRTPPPSGADRKWLGVYTKVVPRYNCLRERSSKKLYFLVQFKLSFFYF